MSLLYQSLRIQSRVIGALLLREVMTRFGRHNIGMFWLVVEPMLFTLGVAGLWMVTRFHDFTEVPAIAFAITGYSSVLVWRNAANRCTKAVEPNLSLMYHRNVKVIDIFLARVLLELIGASGSLILLTFVCACFEFMPWPDDLGLALGGWLLLCWFAVSLGLLIGAVSERSEFFDRIWHVITYLFFPLSGALFMVDWLPSDFRELILWVPTVHGVEMLRHGFFGDVIPTHENPEYFVAINLCLMLAGLALVRECGRRVQPE
jgi:capsular polysaccharide transport system permease protein